MSLDEYFSTGPTFERPVFDEVYEFVSALGPDVRVEFVSVGVFFKKKTNFAELRPLTKWSNLLFKLPRKMEHPAITKTWPGPKRTYYVARLKLPSDVTDDVRGWLAEAYEND